MLKTNNTDLNKNKPGKPPTSADFSKIDQETFNEKKVQNWESKNGSSNNINYSFVPSRCVAINKIYSNVSIVQKCVTRT